MSKIFANMLRPLRPQLKAAPPRALVRTEPARYSEVHEVFMNEYAVTRSSDPKPILVTYGLHNCVGIAGFCKEKGFGFVAHYAKNTNVDLAINNLITDLSALAKHEQVVFEVKITGGITNMSESLINRLKEKLQKAGYGKITFELVEQDILGSSSYDRAVGIDTKSGKFVTAYDTHKNPNRRDLRPTLFATALVARGATLSYFPGRSQTHLLADFMMGIYGF